MTLRHALLLALALVAACHGPYSSVYLVRHAEKAATPPNDPPLTDEGMARARKLADMMQSAALVAVYSTDTLRTMTTARTVADAKGLGVTLYTNTAAGIAQLATAVKAVPPDKAVLIVGHTTNIPSIIAALGAPIPSTLPNPIPEDDYDNFVWMLQNGRDPPLSTSFPYGAKSPPPDGGTP